MKKIVIAAAAASLVATAAYAAVEVDVDGFGFIGKGDVQLALTLNNAQLQAAASSLDFEISSNAHYGLECVKENLRNTVEVTVRRHSKVSSDVAYESRQGKKHITGFNMKGIKAGTTVETGTDALVCPQSFTQDGDAYVISTTGAAMSVNGVALN